MSSENKPVTGTSWHTQPVESVFEKLSTGEDGLSRDEANSKDPNTDTVNGVERPIEHEAALNIEFSVSPDKLQKKALA